MDTNSPTDTEMANCYLRHILSKILDLLAFLRFGNRVLGPLLARFGRSRADFRTPRDVAVSKEVVNVQFRRF